MALNTVTLGTCENPTSHCSPLLPYLLLRTGCPFVSVTCCIHCKYHLAFLIFEPDVGLKMIQSTARVVRLVLGCQQGVLDEAQRSDVLTAGRRCAPSRGERHWLNHLQPLFSLITESLNGTESSPCHARSTRRSTPAPLRLPPITARCRITPRRLREDSQ